MNAAGDPEMKSIAAVKPRSTTVGATKIAGATIDEALATGIADGRKSIQ